MNKFLEENDEKLVFNNQTGAYGYILYGKLLVLKSNREKINALLDQKARGVINKPIVHIDNHKWMQLPKIRFKNYKR